MPEALTDARWFLAAGVVLIAMALASSVLRRLPLSSSMIYLAAGAVLGPIGLGMIIIDPAGGGSGLLEVVSEVAVILSLFTAGLKLRLPISDRGWWIPVRLAFVSMALTVGLIALAGVTLLGLPLGAAVLLGAILAPTDPVLASDVQVGHPGDPDQLRFALTGEAGLNDGTAFPFVMLGLGLLGLHDLGENGLRWVAVDLVWSVAVGLAVGALLGTLVARLVVHLRSTHREAVGLDEFLALGLIGISYGAALMVGGYGFLAVFAAGLALRRIERTRTNEDVADELEAGEGRGGRSQEEVATHPETAPAFMARALLTFNEQLERIGEVAVVVLVGAALTIVGVPLEVAWFAPLLFLVIRPLAVLIGLAGASLSRTRLIFIGWFGIRGVGSVYYLSYAITHDLQPDVARTLAAITLSVVAASVLVHGISVTPLMSRYERRLKVEDGAS
ncbi:MAG: cation:proton antiporter [Chloroflexota bacterium]|nr:cation:proton antiporter [Chloroflexota bacterium]